MADLDTLFGPGTAAAFSTKVDLSAQFPTVTATTLEWTNPDGTVGTETRWATSKGVLVGYWRLVYRPPEVYGVGLVVEPGFQGKGALTQLCAAVPPWWATLGLTRYATMTTPGSNAERMLRLAGLGPQPDGYWGFPIPSPRLEEAAAYVKAKQEGQNPPQPAWREGLPAPSGEPF